MVVTTKEYNKDKRDFLNRHGDFTVHTSSLDEYNSYHKEYVCEDGAVFYEVNGPEYVTIPVTVNLVDLDIEVELFRTEYWSSDNAKSKFCYEKY